MNVGSSDNFMFFHIEFILKSYRSDQSSGIVDISFETLCLYLSLNYLVFSGETSEKQKTCSLKFISLLPRRKICKFSSFFGVGNNH